MESSLREEQEKILASLSQMLPGSSQETLLNPEDVEKVQNEGKLIGILQENHGECVTVHKRSVPRKKRKNNCPFTVVRRKRRRRREKKLVERNTEENDSGLGTSSEILKCAPPEVTEHSDSEDSVTSMESVSLLQIANCTAMEGDDVSTGVNLAWNVKIFPPLDDDDDGGMETITMADKSVQTVHVTTHSDDSIMQNVNFISSVIRLKQIFSNRTSISREDFANILKRLPEADELKSPIRSEEVSSDDSDAMEVSGRDGLSLVAERRSRRRYREMVSCENFRYVMRQTNAEDVTEQSVDSILAWLKDEIEKNGWRTVYYYWDGSVTAEAVDVINEAVDSDVIGIRKKVSLFLAGILNEIHDGDVEDAVAEFKVAFLSSFCKSILLQYDLILQVDGNLSAVISSASGRGLEVVDAKKTYFTLRLMENLFRLFLTGLNTRGFEEVFRVRWKDTDAGVLNMWRKNWMGNEVFTDEMGNFHSKYVKVIGGWCNRVDEIVNFSLRESPVLSLVAQNCSSLARKILTKLQSVGKE